MVGDMVGCCVRQSVRFALIKYPPLRPFHPTASQEPRFDPIALQNLLTQFVFS